MKFPESKRAHDLLDGLEGIEIGGSAHNPFNIPGCLNVDYTDDPETESKVAEILMCGERLPVDIVDEGDTLSKFGDETLEYIISSHVFEHFPDPLKALKNWRRVLKPGGIAYLTVPLPWAAEADDGRPITTWLEMAKWHNLGYKSIEEYPVYPGHGVRGHYHVYSPESLCEAIYLYSGLIDFRFTIIAADTKDDKVGNGFTLVLKKTHMKD